MSHSVYDLIKKHNGEHFARAIRDANLMELPGIVEMVRYAGRDAKRGFIEYLLAEKANRDLADAYAIDGADPFELLHQAGYDFVEYADTFEKQNAIKKYFAQGEELCTFKDKNRYQEYYIVNAVRGDADKIQRAESPDRQDAYGTSVISIQMRKSGGFISIKNRYNHTVNNPDNTFNSNPDNIIPGLSAALKFYFKVDFEALAKCLPEGMGRIDNHIIKYNYEIDNVYIGDYFWESHGQIHEIDKSTQMMMDYFYFDIKHNKVVPIVSTCDDCFADVLNAEINGRRVTVRGKYPNQSLWIKDTCLVEMDGSAVKSINLAKTKVIGWDFFRYNTKLTSFQAPNLTKVGSRFLVDNLGLVHLGTPKLKTIDNDCLFYNGKLADLSLPELKRVGDNFLCQNGQITSLDLPNLTHVGDSFLHENIKLKNLFAPNLKTVGWGFLHNNMDLSELSLPSLTRENGGFLASNASKLVSVDLPNLTSVGARFLYSNKGVKSLSLPKLQSAGSDFLFFNEILESLDAPLLKTVENNFLSHNLNITQLSLPNLGRIGNDFLYCNRKLARIDIPNVKKIGTSFCYCNEDLGQLDVPNLVTVDEFFLMNNRVLDFLNVPKLKTIGFKFCYKNNGLVHLDMPNLTHASSNFLGSNRVLKSLRAPRFNIPTGVFLGSNLNLETLELGDRVSLNLLLETLPHVMGLLKAIIAQQKAAKKSAAGRRPKSTVPVLPNLSQFIMPQRER